MCKISVLYSKKHCDLLFVTNRIFGSLEVGIFTPLCVCTPAAKQKARVWANLIPSLHAGWKIKRIARVRKGSWRRCWAKKLPDAVLFILDIGFRTRRIEMTLFVCTSRARVWVQSLAPPHATYNIYTQRAMPYAVREKARMGIPLFAPRLTRKQNWIFTQSAHFHTFSVLHQS